MTKRKFMFMALISIACVCFLTVANRAAYSRRPGTLLFTGYPDGAEWLMVEVMRRIGDAYDKAHHGMCIRLEPGLSYWQSRTKVLEGEAAGLMISEEMNRYRAYASQSGGSRGFNELKLDRFIPISVRVIRSRNQVLARMRLGIATDRMSKELKQFLSFLKTDAAKEAIAGIPDMEIAVPSSKPVFDKRGLKRGGEVQLEKPVLSY